MEISSISLRGAFVKLLNDLSSAPIVQSRVGKTRELLGVQVKISNPYERLMKHPDRNYNLAFNIAETLSHISGVNSVDYLSFYNSNIENFSDNGINYYGNYGVRLGPYFRRLIQKLSKSPETRQAVMTIYNTEDAFVRTKDTPCTVALDFKVRNNKLYLHAFMRSNDLVWGFQYDVFAFTLIQEIIANTLGLELGAYTHTASSMHIYERHWKLLESKRINVESTEMKVPDIDYEEALKTAKEAVRIAHGNKDKIFNEFNVNNLVKALDIYAAWNKPNRFLRYENSEKNVPEWIYYID